MFITMGFRVKMGLRRELAARLRSQVDSDREENRLERFLESSNLCMGPNLSQNGSSDFKALEEA